MVQDSSTSFLHSLLSSSSPFHLPILTSADPCTFYAVFFHLFARLCYFEVLLPGLYPTLLICLSLKPSKITYQGFSKAELLLRLLEFNQPFIIFVLDLLYHCCMVSHKNHSVFYMKEDISLLVMSTFFSSLSETKPRTRVT